MLRKTLISLIAVVILLGSVSLSYAKPASANPLLRIVAGSVAERALVGIAEKIGMKLSQKQIGNAAAYINRQAMQGDAKATAFIEGSKNLTGTATKSGWKKYLLDPMLWLTGADLLFNVYNAFHNAYDDGSGVPILIDKPACLPDGVLANYAIFYNGSEKKLATWGSEKGSAFYGTTLQVDMTASDHNLLLSTWNGSLSKWGAFTVNNSYDASYRFFMTATRLGTNTMGVSTTDVCEAVEKEETYYPQLVDIANVSNVDNSLKQMFDNDTYNINNITYNMEMEMPDVPDYSVPWNEPLSPSEIKIIVDSNFPAPPDDGNSGPPAEIPSNFFELMANVGGKIIDTYNGIVKFASDSVTAMGSLVTGTAGLVTFLGTFFSWLPAPFVSLLSVGFMMGVLAFFLRR